VPDTAPRAGKLPEQVLQTLSKSEPASAQPQEKA
jgi:hypothetical protein